MARWLLAGFMLATVSVTAARTQTAAEFGPILYLVRAEPLEKDISVSVIWTRPDILNVQVHKGASEVNVIGGHLPKAAQDLAIQTWVLKSDGTALSRRAGPGEYPGLGRPSTSSTDWSLTWGFRYAEPSDLAAVVIRVGGGLFVRPIPQKPPAN
jgi:hypothetical protein